MTKKILVTRHVYPEAIELLQGCGELEYHDSSSGLDRDTMLRAVADKQAVVCQLTDPMDAEVMDAAPELKVIANVAVGFDNIDVAAATERGIVVSNTPGVLTDTTADFAFTLLMAAARRVTEAERFLRDGRWQQWEIDMFSGQDINHHTLGIYGLGRIGRCMARRATGFDMRVIYHDAVRADYDEQLGLKFVDKETLFRESDFVSIHVPLNDETRHCVGAPELALMKPTAILINTSRGPVVDELALAQALAEKRIAGAGLDVYENEPTVSPELLALDNLVMAPHIASASVKTRTRMCVMAAENAAAVINGERPPNPVNPEVL
ncbi:MAG: D-glycerate dehydrogenase [Xanthomonadales bacterium]|nr:D-glycerate dehydrogenase [Xanthomonadales bacterium]